MDEAEIRRLTELEDRHWWYAERRSLVRRWLRRVPLRGVAIDVGAAGGGNARVLHDAGWPVVALEYSAVGSQVARSRGLHVVRADAHRLPFGDASAGAVVAFDILEHLADDVLALSEIRRVLMPGAPAFIAVPADPALWSAHDDAVGHLRRYTRSTLAAACRDARLVLDDVRSWNVLLRPAVARQRRRMTGSALDRPAAPLNLGLRAAVVLERVLPGAGRLPGVSLLGIAHRPADVEPEPGGTSTTQLSS